MAGAKLSRAAAEAVVSALREADAKGFLMPGSGLNDSEMRYRSATAYARRKLGIPEPTFRSRLKRARELYPDLFAAQSEDDGIASPGAKFSFVGGHPDADKIDADKLIATLSARHAKRAKSQRELIPVDIHEDGPIGIAFIGDPHVDDPGCAWGDLKRDVELIQRTAGAYAIGVGDWRNNWVGRLTELYAKQEVTQKEALVLIEWLFKRLGGKMITAIAGNHDHWLTLGGDPVAFLAKLSKLAGSYGDDSYRLELRLPAGARARVHVRHDFPGQSQFNPAHALVRETLWGYRDHILACGHRHSSGYIPIWHNDPKRLCQGIRVGTYKDFDEYAKVKGFRHENWARSMFAIIDPRYADDPVEFVTVRFSVEAGIRELKARRVEWRADANKAPAKPIRQPKADRASVRGGVAASKSIKKRRMSAAAEIVAARKKSARKPAKRRVRGR